MECALHVLNYAYIDEHMMYILIYSIHICYIWRELCIYIYMYIYICIYIYIFFLHMTYTEARKAHHRACATMECPKGSIREQLRLAKSREAL